MATAPGSGRRAAPRAAAPQPVAPERPARDREATKARILGAVGVVLARDGFGAVGVNAIAKEAGVDKVLIYRYFGGLPELLREWGASGRFWPRVDELLGDDPQAFLALPPPERYAPLLRALHRRPARAAADARDPRRRDRRAQRADRHSRDRARGSGARRRAGCSAATSSRAAPRCAALTLLLVAGVQYLLVRSRKIRIFGGLDLTSDAGWDELKASIRRHRARGDRAAARRSEFAGR